MSKRRRKFGRVARRPIDKQIITISQTVPINGETTILTILRGATTLTGLRWNFGVASNQDISDVQYNWALVIVKDGDTANALNVGNNQQMYTPEQNVMSWGTGILTKTSSSAGPATHQWEGTTKSMRKMMEGDNLTMVFTSNVTNGVIIHGAIQLFLMF